MGWWLINADALAGGRFVISALAETSAALFNLDQAAAAHPGERTWLDTHLPGYRRRLAADPVTALLISTVFGHRYIADFFMPAPPSAPATFHEELAKVRETPDEIVRKDLEVAQRGPIPRALHRSGLADRAADLLEWVWTETVEPDWQRRKRILEADIVARTGRLGQDGWAAALDDMRPGMRWLGEGRLQINTYDYPPREIGRAELLFVPVTPRRGWVSWDEPYRYAVVYPCSGALIEPDAVSPPQSLAKLLGPVRASVLVILDSPKSTTQLVALTGHGLGSVGRHLKILLDARLVRRRRVGRSVLYFRTEAGDALVFAQTASE